MSTGKLIREQLHPSVYFSSVRDPKFRHNSISINLITPLEPDKAAATAILPCLLRKGSRHFPDYTLLEQQLCELYGASLGSDIMKHGGQHVVCCSISFVDDAYTLGGEVISDRCAELLSDMVLCPKIDDGVFDSDDFELERQNLIDTIEAEINDKRTYAINKCMEMLFEGSRLATPRYGTVEGARALTPADAARRYAEVMDTAQVEIIFVGCGDPSAAREKFRKSFSLPQRHPIELVPEPHVTCAGAVKEKRKEMAVAQSKLVLGMRAGSLATPAERYAAKLMTMLYGGTPNSRLFVNVREKLSLCYYCAARIGIPTAILMVDIGVEKENRDRAQEAILAQLDVLRNGAFEDSELAETKLAYANGVRSYKDSLGSLESWYLIQILDGGQSSPDEEVANVCAVTREQVCAAAQKVTLDSIYFLTGAEEVKADEQ